MQSVRVCLGSHRREYYVGHRIHPRDAAEETFNLRRFLGRFLEEPVPYLLRNGERRLDLNFQIFWFSLSIGCFDLNLAKTLWWVDGWLIIASCRSQPVVLNFSPK